MKKGNEKTLKKGISLIVLVITIIVIVVLATAVILSIANNNPIDNAKEAVEKNNEAEYKSELSLYIAKQYADNQGDYSMKNVNAFSKDAVNKIVTLMKDEELDDYIIWQGELVKKESDGCYYYENGEAVKTFDMQTIESKIDLADESKGRQNLNQNMVDFLIEFEKIQENYSEEERLVYTGGYIYNIYGKTALKIKEKLPEGVVIKNAKLESEVADNQMVGTDYGLYYNGNLVARFVKVGDSDCDGMVNMNDYSLVRTLIDKKIEDLVTEYTKGRLLALDANENGIIDQYDIDFTKNKNYYGK